jgi:hypothetical protein
VALIAAAIPPILAEICLKGENTGRFHSSRATDRRILNPYQSAIDKHYSRLKGDAVN